MTGDKSAIDYLVIGHVTRDVTAAGFTPGGTVTFAGQTARALGCRTAVLTSARPDWDLSDPLGGIAVHVVPAAENTIFENRYDGNQRSQWLRGRAARLGPADLPAAWRRPAVVHLGPVADEIEPAVVEQFPHSLIGLTPQGWMRRWNGEGRIFAASFPAEEYLLGRAAAVVLSEEDLVDEAMLDRYVRWSKILVLTRNDAGCTLFIGGRARQVPAPAVDLVEPTGAGDIFAAAFFIQLWRSGGDPLQAAVFANQVAAHSVTRRSLMEKVVAWE